MKRRNFLKASVMAATTLSASRIEGVSQTIFDNKRVFGANRFGLFWANLNSGQVVSVDSFEGDKFPNTMNYSLPDVVQNENRVLYPMVRKSYLKAKGPAKSELRGKDEFVRVSWDVALDLAAKALKENFDKYGSEAVYGECYWWGGSGKVSWGRTVAHRMLKVLGGYVEESGDYSTGAGLVIMPHVVGSSSVYDTPTKWRAIAKNAKNVVFWGTDPLVTGQISWVPPTHDGYLGLQELKKSDAKIYSVNVMVNETAKYFGSQNLIVRPNTDTAMAIAMCHYLYTNNLYDAEFIKKYTVGFNKFKDYFMGKNDGVEKNLEWASKICGLDVKSMADLATKLAKEPSTIIIGRALQRADHGELAFWSLVTLSAMLGHIGKEGLGFEYNLYYSNGATDKIAPALKGISTRISEKYDSVDNAPWRTTKNITIPSSRSIQALLNPGKEIDYDGVKIKLPHMRVAYMASGSMFTRHQNVNNAVKAWRKFDTVITAEPYWTSTAKLSDIVLPVAIEIERDDINQTAPTGEYIVANRPIIEPMGESRSDYWICHEICKRWGRGDVFSEGKTEKEWAKEFYEDAQAQAKNMGLNMPSFDEFWQVGYVQFKEDKKESEYYTRFADFRADPAKNRLGTPSGKIEIYSPVIAKFGYDDCPAHPAWIEPFEWLGSDIAKKYPIHVVSPHSRYRLHSQLNNSIIRNFAEVSGREPMLINPKTAEIRGIKTGDIVRVFNDRGEILAGALLTDLVQENVAIICEGAWYDPEIWGEKSLCQHGCVNVLTNDKGTSKLAQSNTAHTTLAQVEKFKGKILPIKAFSKPNIVQSL
ncbi:molybdopterin-dependent oxidoreductase [Campylobacter mucosalis]|uniref:Molybdopterin-containing oxidoreductase III, DMSO/TMAO/BSO reductase family, catalytic subunit n=1 Tax=Campylobacter mucosalis CCUG 21559 TaxID=1032067 RepID=A0A6G5QE94_9BACT|nr:molybdopterin-dependent oxidoreductase [Campylobacter mucosalis]QCD43909.1 molybdopterin-containing oxidoreductase III, DMSO/TMAO/BSO reductase family, catalytic subunit [Campylobacter mucosalis CCUG 21559]